MKTFREFAQDKDFEAVKSIVLDILDPDGDSIANEKSILTRPLSDFKHKHQLLTAPSLADIINRRRNRGAIVQAIQNNNTTIGNLLSLLTTHEEPENLG
jgi:hypothetical protein